MRKNHVEKVIKDLTEWKEKVFGSGLELKVSYTHFLGYVDRISIHSGLPRSMVGSGYSAPKSSEELLKTLKKEVVESGWSHADYPKINPIYLNRNDFELFRDYLKKLEDELTDTQIERNNLQKEQKSLIYSIETIKNRIDQRRL